LYKIHSNQATENLRRLFAPLEFNLAIPSILSGNTPGLLYADDPSQPSVALACFKHHLFLAGSPAGDDLDQSLAQVLCGELLVQARQEGLTALLLAVTDPAWEAHLNSILPCLEPIHDLRQYYACRRLAGPWQPLLPPGYRLRQADAALLDTPGLSGVDALRMEMVSERPSVEDFLQRSFGVCLQYDEAIVGFCLSEYNCAGRCEVGVWTAESHRQRGLGKLMSLALVEQALRGGYSEVGWHCWADNLPSAALALSAGFGLQREYPVYVYLLEE
jgi:RimJ/RimL family protein N-acetyltransferase